ncbi:MAG: serine/threonine protein kinase [Phycisphaerales bacterium]
MIDPNYEEALRRGGLTLEQLLEGRDPDQGDRSQVLDAVRVFLEIHPEISADAARERLSGIIPDYKDDHELEKILGTHSFMATLSRPRPQRPSYVGELLPDGLGRFKIIDTIGKGGQSTIYKAVDRENAHDESVYVTVKLYDHFDGSEGIRAKKINHPNLVPFVAQGVEDIQGQRHGYTVYRFLDGVTLDQWVPEHSPDRREVLRFMIKLTNAVVAMHGVGVFHRDLKPQNIIVVDNSPVIIDYGVSTSGEEIGSQAGTPTSMAPEQLTHIVHSAKVDIYGLGSIAYFMLTHRYPNGQDREEALKNLRAGREPDCSTISGALGDVLARCLSKHIPRRYDSASALEHDLRSIQENRPTSNQSPGVMIDSVLFFRRHPLLTTSAAFFFAALLYLLFDARSEREIHEHMRRVSLQAMVQSMVQAQLDHDCADPAAYVVLGELGHGMNADWTQLTNLMNEDGELRIQSHIAGLATDPAYSRIKLHYWYVTLARVQAVVYPDLERTRVSYVNARNALLEILKPDDPLVVELDREMRQATDSP